MSGLSALGMVSFDKMLLCVRAVSFRNGQLCSVSGLSALGMVSFDKMLLCVRAVSFRNGQL